MLTDETAVCCSVRPSPRVLLIDPSDAGRAILAERLRFQGFVVVECKDGAEGAIQALEEAPDVVIADLSMPSISGVQLCRLLGSEPGTSKVPVVLRGSEGRRNHFWAEQAGAFAYVIKGRMGELVRALRRAIEQKPHAEPDDFFVVGLTQSLDVRERIATHLDAALFDSVIAAEVRRLGTSESFDRLVDLLSQFVSQVTSYRWMAVWRLEPMRLGIHSNPANRAQALVEAGLAFGGVPDAPVVAVEDDDAVTDPSGPAAIVEAIYFGDQLIGSFALAPRAQVHQNDPVLVKIIGRELGGALRMATLVEESRWMATTDALTGLSNRRAFIDWATREVARCARYSDHLSVILLDVDHFKQVNDRYGHASGDAVLAAVSRLMASIVRTCDVVARWGGEEFVVALPSTSLEGAMLVAERIRAALERHPIADPSGLALSVTASFGVAQLDSGETVDLVVDRADRAMYAAKSAGRNRVLSTAQLVQPLNSLSPLSSPQSASTVSAVVSIAPKKTAEA
ncbi:MAG TPA: diguanylate cyclase [Polyangiaceae bacterium]|nr:diguanylate cyclase [Polyangiaceae bacterium]